MSEAWSRTNSSDCAAASQDCIAAAGRIVLGTRERRVREAQGASAIGGHRATAQKGSRMKALRLLGIMLVFVVARRATAGTFFGALSNFDAVNDGFEIELDDIQSRDVTYTFQFQRYAMPKIVEDTFLVNGVSHPRTFVRWMSAYDQVNHVFTEASPVAPAASRTPAGIRQWTRRSTSPWFLR